MNYLIVKEGKSLGNADMKDIIYMCSINVLNIYVYNIVIDLDTRRRY